MNRDAIGKLQLVNVCIVEHRKALVVKYHAQRAVVFVDLVDGAKVAVKRARPVLAAAVGKLFAPFDLVVVLHLHDAIAFAEDGISADVLVLVRSGRVERRL